MPKGEADLIMHPLRFRILQTLLGRQMNTQQISLHMPHIPVSSIYRHLKILLDAGLVQVVDTNRIKGIEEKVYTVGQEPRVSPEEINRSTKEENQRFFAAYLSYLLKGFSDFLQDPGVKDLQAEHAGFTETLVYASDEELERFVDILNKALALLHENEKAPNRQRQLFSIITFPVERKEEQE